MKTQITATTNGKSKNTEEARPVIISKLAIGYSNLVLYPEDDFVGGLRAYFEPSGFTEGSWNVEAYGYIFGDKQWLKEFKQGLRQLGFSVKAVQNVQYDELTLQGNDYVSLSIGKAFYASWKRLNKKVTV